MSAEKTTKAEKEKPVKAAKAPKAAKPKKEQHTPAELAPLYEVILAPVITEKATNNSQFNQVTFRVHPGSNKPQIRKAVEALFKVKVTAVNTQNRMGKTKRVKGRKAFRSDSKIAIVTLAEGNSIDVTTGL
jgi:large subunit ribosomal protein L23